LQPISRSLRNGGEPRDICSIYMRLSLFSRKLAEVFNKKGAVPQIAPEDAIHIAVAVVNGIDYLISWNCKHIANAKMRSKIEQVCLSRGYEPIIICTPEELLED
jgi:hypothetical protein